MHLERSKNAKRNMIAGFINRLVSMMFPVLIRSLMIQKMGVEYLGLNSLFSSILQVLNLAELGFGNALVYNMYKPIAENDKNTICALLRAYKIIYRVVGIVILALGMILLPFIPRLIKDTYPREINIYLLFLIYLANTIISYWLFAYKTSLLNAFQRADIISNVGSIIRILLNISQMLILCTIRNYYIYVIMFPLFTAINNLISAYMTDKMFGEYICEGTLSKEIAANIRQNVMGLTVSKICQTSRNSFDSIFISAFMGLSISAVYSNYYYVMSAVLTVGIVIAGAVRAIIGNSVVCYDAEKNYADMTKFNFLYMWISGWCTVCLMCLMQPFMVLWVGREYMFDLKIVIMMCVYFYSLKMGDIRELYSDAKGLWWQNRYRDIIEAILNLILNYVFGKLWGVSGIILATLISLFLLNFCYGSHIVFKHYFRNEKVGEYFRLHVFYGITTLIACFVTYRACGLIYWNGIAGMLMKFVICCIVPNCVYMVIYYRTRMYKEAIPWIMKVMK